MTTRTRPIDLTLAKALGLTPKQVPRDPCTYGMPRLDWKLYDRIRNPKSAVSERFVKERGNPHLFIGGMILSHIGDGALECLERLAERCPHLPHLTEWKARFEAKKA